MDGRLIGSILSPRFAAFICIALVAAAAAAPPAENHPIIGTWKFTLPNGKCSETYHFRPDGTTLVTSAEEVSVSIYDISPERSSNDFYKLVDKITKNNGKKDCNGGVTELGDEVTRFVRFHPSGIMFIMCITESTDTCIGPFVRDRGQDS